MDPYCPMVLYSPGSLLSHVDAILVKGYVTSMRFLSKKEMTRHSRTTRQSKMTRHSKNIRHSKNNRQSKNTKAENHQNIYEKDVITRT